MEKLQGLFWGKTQLIGAKSQLYTLSIRGEGRFVDGRPGANFTMEKQRRRRHLRQKPTTLVHEFSCRRILASDADKNDAHDMEPGIKEQLSVSALHHLVLQG